MKVVKKLGRTPRNGGHEGKFAASGNFLVVNNGNKTELRSEWPLRKET